MGVASALGAFFGTTVGTAANPIAAPVTEVTGLVKDVIDRVVPDKQAAQAAQASLLATEVQAEIQVAAGQMQINLAEAQSKSVFVAGWRPFLGWIGGLGVGYEFVLRPLLNFTFQKYHLVAPALELQDLLGLLGTMLGMGAMRSYDKSQGTSNGH